MKKILGFLFIISLFLTFIPKVSRAWDTGCLPGDVYSRTTGMLCNSFNNYNNNYVYNYNLPYGCRPGDTYSMYTGQYCGNTYGGTYNNFYSQTYYLGETGSDIVALQQFLQNAGYYFGTIDGVFGPMTKNAWVKYQSIYPNQNNYGCQTNCNYGNQPVITSVSGPQSLNVNQMGTWTVNAYSNNAYNTYNNNLSYSVNWGDQNVYPYMYGALGSQNSVAQQNATFTHTYLQSGIYTVVFTVTNSWGQTAQSTLSVNVTGYSGYSSAPYIYSLSPISGPIGTLVTIYGSGFNSYCPYGNYCGNSANLPTIVTVNFGGGTLQGFSSYNGTSLTFNVPSSLSNCITGLYCTQYYRPVTPGTYPVSVSNSNGTSNSLNFQVY